MLKLKYLILLLSCTAVCLGSDPAKPATTVAPNSSTPNTTDPTTTSTTTTTTTVAPSSTTPNTTDPTTTTTATPPPPPSTTVAPTPIPEPVADTWMVVNKSNHDVCIVAQMAMQVKVSYALGNETKEAIINLPFANETKFDGDCDRNGTQALTIFWNNNSLELSFAQNSTEKEFMLEKLNFTAQLNNKSVTAVLDKAKFVTPLSMSYKCDREETLKLAETPNVNDTITISLWHVQFEAFRTENSTKFSTAQDCRTPTQDIVPIAVGCALAALVVIVLIAYLVGRRRVTARGYLSM